MQHGRIAGRQQSCDRRGGGLSCEALQAMPCRHLDPLRQVSGLACKFVAVSRMWGINRQVPRTLTFGLQITCTARSAFCMLRQAMMMLQPRPIMATAVANPMPALPPVMTHDCMNSSLVTASDRYRHSCLLVSHSSIGKSWLQRCEKS